MSHYEDFLLYDLENNGGEWYEEMVINGNWRTNPNNRAEAYQITAELFSYFEAYGRQVYRIGPNLQNLLRHTSLSGVEDLRRIRLPYPAFYVEMYPPAPIQGAILGKERDLHGLYILHKDQSEEEFCQCGGALQIYMHTQERNKTDVVGSALGASIMMPIDYKKYFREYLTRDNGDMLGRLNLQSAVSFLAYWADIWYIAEQRNVPVRDFLAELSITETETGETQITVGSVEGNKFSDEEKEFLSVGAAFRCMGVSLGLNFVAYMNTTAIEKKMAQLPLLEERRRMGLLSKKLKKLTKHRIVTPAEKKLIEKLRKEAIKKSIGLMTVTKISPTLEKQLDAIRQCESTGEGGEKSPHWRQGHYAWKWVGSGDNKKYVLRWHQPSKIHPESEYWVERARYEIDDKPLCDGVWSWEDPAITPEMVEDTYVYFLQNATTKNIKIGWSKEPIKRITRGKTFNENRLVLLGWFNGTAKDEQILHERFAEDRIPDGGTEWFKYSAELQATMDEVIQQNEKGEEK